MALGVPGGRQERVSERRVGNLAKENRPPDAPLDQELLSRHGRFDAEGKQLNSIDYFPGKYATVGDFLLEIFD